MHKSPIICLTGPTAVGKSQLAIALADTFPCDIISVDSMMVYRGMDIGTAKPEPDILSRVSHELVNIRHPSEPYSAGDFFRDAQQKISNTLAKGRIPLLVGGTMLYFHTLKNGLMDLSGYITEGSISSTLHQSIKETDLAALYHQLKQYDPKSAERIHANDTQRIQRAVLIYYLTGQPLSVLQKTTQKTLDYEAIWMALYPTSREQIRTIIAQRFHMMLKKGLIEEVRSLYENLDISYDLPACRAVGYRQVGSYLLGKIDYQTMITRSITATCQLAKRQLTWLNNWPEMHFFNSDDPSLLNKIKNYIIVKLNQ